MRSERKRIERINQRIRDDYQAKIKERMLLLVGRKADMDSCIESLAGLWIGIMASKRVADACQTKIKYMFADAAVSIGIDRQDADQVAARVAHQAMNVRKRQAAQKNRQQALNAI